MQPIQVFEYGKLIVGESYNGVAFQQRHLDLLFKYHGDRSDDQSFFSLINHGVRFKQFVGVICVGDLQIEVLPKADNTENADNNFWQERLMDMLKVVYRLKVHSPSANKDNLKHSRILDIFLQRFMDEAERLLHIGLVKTYHQKDENCNTLKGKLLFSKNISQNCVHKERFFVRHTVYDYNHTCNRIIAKVLRLIPDITGNSYTRNRAKCILFEFPELLDIKIDSAMFDRMQYNRKTEDYRMAMDIAKLILLRYMPKLKGENAHDHVLALMFDMNRLWEEYVYLILRKQLSEYDVTAQESMIFWESDVIGSKAIKPDIVIKKRCKCIAILDTKWKIPKDEKPSDADLKQMFAYHHYWKTTKTALLYPGNDKKVIKGKFKERATFFCPNTVTKLECSMVFLPIKEREEEMAQSWAGQVEELIQSRL